MALAPAWIAVSHPFPSGTYRPLGTIPPTEGPMMNAAKLKSHLYLKAVRWLAASAPPSQTLFQWMDNPAVQLSAHLWGRTALMVATDVLDAQQK